MAFQTFVNEAIERVEKTGADFIHTLSLAERLKEAMLYSFTAGGKRLRPLLMLAVLDGFNIPIEKGLRTACAIEFIHTSSLIHDDLPAMDDDDYRRGKLTNHRVFGEATAILAGDALLLHAFELIATDDRLEDSVKVSLIKQLSQSSGANGMVGGQQLDIENEGKPLTLEALETINANKTGQLILFSLLAGGLIAGVDGTTLERLRKISHHIGLAFQIQDDILDVIGDEALLGKATLQDEKNNKTTYVRLLGLEPAKIEVKHHFDQAINELKRLRLNSNFLHQLLQLMIERKY